MLHNGSLSPLSPTLPEGLITPSSMEIQPRRGREKMNMNTQTNRNEIECPCGRIAKRASGDLPLCPACYAGEPDTISLALWALRSGRRLGVRPAEVRLEMKATLRERRERMQGEHPTAERDEWIAAKIAEWC